MKFTKRYTQIYSRLLLGLALLLSSTITHALTIGEPKVISRMNEPLRAELPLLSLTQEELTGLSVRNASAATYRAMGLPYSRKLKKMSVKVKVNNGQHYVELTTPYHVREPMIDLVLTIEHGRGRLIRNFTLMLEPGNL